MTADDDQFTLKIPKSSYTEKGLGFGPSASGTLVINVGRGEELCELVCTAIDPSDRVNIVITLRRVRPGPTVSRTSAK